MKQFDCFNVANYLISEIDDYNTNCAESVEVLVINSKRNKNKKHTIIIHFCKLTSTISYVLVKYC